MTERASSDREGSVQSHGTGHIPPSQDLLDAFEEHGWEGDLAGALADAPFNPPPVESGQHPGEWQTLFQDYLRGLPGHIRDKYAIRQSG